MGRVFSWLFVVAALYVLSLAAFAVANIATIAVMSGADVLTGETITALVLRAAVFAAPIALLSSLFVLFTAAR